MTAIISIFRARGRVRTPWTVPYTCSSWIAQYYEI